MLPAMDLRDQLAIRFAAALAGLGHDAAEIARRAYDLADALLAERERRIDADEAEAIAGEPRRGSLWPPAVHPALLDEPVPMDESEWDHEEEIELRARDMEYDPSWDLEPRWAAPGSSPRPGLARTQPEASVGEVAERERSA